LDTPLSLLMGRAVKAAHPVFALLELTYTCNFACRFCYNPVPRRNQPRKKELERPTASPLAFEEYLSVMDQLREMGVLYLTLTGGEPLTHPRFWDIARAAKERTFALRIFTNAGLITEAVADRLAELAPNCLEISIHGAKDETAEALNQTKGSHQALLRALGYLSERSIRVYLKTVLTRLVQDELLEIKAVGERFGYPVFFDPVLTLSDDGEEYPLDLQASDEAVRRLYAVDGINIGNSPFQREPGELNCTVAAGVLHITPYGDIQPCTQWKQSVGNVREHPIAEIWATSPILEEARKVAREMPQLIREGTDAHAFCHHCPGLSLLRYGDPRKLDEQYLRVAQIRRDVAESEARPSRESLRK